MNILAITSCPSGIAHTYMAADALEKAAKAKGWAIKIETQGAIGIENMITMDDVIQADVIILTQDITIKNVERFTGKHIVHIKVVEAVKKAPQIMEQLEAQLTQI